MTPADIPPASATFAAHAADYDAQRRRLVPDYDAFYGAAVDTLGAVDGELGAVLDLGAGTGLLSAAVAAAHPGARMTLLDGAPAMLDRARARLADARADFILADMTAGLPPGPFDAVVSALAIHHLEHEDQRRLLREVHAVLRPGGVFVNAEQMMGPTPALEARYAAAWERATRGAGAGEHERHDARRRMARHDRYATLRQFQQWLDEAGFAAADCVYKSWRFAVVVGVR